MIDPLRIRVPGNWDQFAALRAYVGSVCVGVARLTREGRIATLQDIEIKELRLPVFSFITWPKRRRNFRGLGYGSLLLDEAVLFCRQHQIEILEGFAFGDLEFLLPWYVRHGFAVIDEQQIRMQFER